MPAPGQHRQQFLDSLCRFLVIRVIQNQQPATEFSHQVPQHGPRLLGFVVQRLGVGSQHAPQPGQVLLQTVRAVRRDKQHRRVVRQVLPPILDGQPSLPHAPSP